MATYFRTKVVKGLGAGLTVTGVASGSPSTGYVTLTFSTQGTAPYAIGSSINVSGVSVKGYNGTYLVTGCTATTVSYANSTTGAATGGTVVQNSLATGGANRFTLIGCNLANTTDVDLIVNLTVTDANQTTVYYLNQMMIPPYNSAKIITNGEKLILMENTSLTITSDVATSLDAVISYAEIV
jgi:hypothetical protein